MTKFEAIAFLGFDPRECGDTMGGQIAQKMRDAGWKDIDREPGSGDYQIEPGEDGGHWRGDYSFFTKGEYIASLYFEMTNTALGFRLLTLSLMGPTIITWD